jgi:hypothetical protein
MMCGCCPRYWVTSSRAPSSAAARSRSTAAHDELGAVDLVDRATGLGGAALERRDRVVVVGGRDEVVEHRTVGDLAGELHHLHAGGADVDGHVLRPTLLVHVVELDAVEVGEHAVEGDGLVGEQRAHHGHDSRASR